MIKNKMTRFETIAWYDNLDGSSLYYSHWRGHEKVLLESAPLPISIVFETKQHLKLLVI